MGLKPKALVFESCRLWHEAKDAGFQELQQLFLGPAANTSIGASTDPGPREKCIIATPPPKKKKKKKKMTPRDPRQSNLGGYIY